MKRHNPTHPDQIPCGFGATSRLPSDTQRERVRRAGMTGYDTNDHTNSASLFRSATAETTSERTSWRWCPAKIEAHFPSHLQSFSAKMGSYLLPLPYRPPGERSISSFLRWCRPAVPSVHQATPVQRCSISKSTHPRRSGHEGQSPYYGRVLDVTANPLVGFPSAHRSLISALIA